MKKSLFSTKTMVATGLGAALFLVLFMYVKVPSPVPSTNLQIAYGISTFFAAVFGPICGFLVAFIGHALNDFIFYGSPWWSWVIASGFSGLITGMVFFSLNVEDGKLNKKDMIKFVVWTLVANFVAWVGIAPILDILMYAEPANFVFTQGFMAFVLNVLCSIVIGGAILLAYSNTKVSVGSLSKKK